MQEQYNMRYTAIRKGSVSSEMVIIGGGGGGVAGLTTAALLARFGKAVTLFNNHLKQRSCKDYYSNC
jgi:heterodisulfide reductase subunit A-like polyferredoxin